jgi:hypothetical protein
VGRKAVTPHSLTPGELFDHRLAALHSRTVEEMLEALTPAAYRKWQLYWLEEPWGPWRDNLHAAIIGRTILRPWTKKGDQIDLDQFMIRRREQDAPNRVTTFVRWLFRISKPAQPPPEEKP